jgi:transcriptional regulator with XRE-family HTH domain
MIVQTIRKEIASSNKTRYQIAKESGVSEAQLCRLMQGKTITCETADILLQYFGYKLKKGQMRK